MKRFLSGVDIEDGPLYLRDITNSSGDIVTVNGSGQFFKRTPSEIRADIGAAAIGDLHDPVTLGTPANGLSLVGQQLSIGLASSGVTGALSGTDWNTFNGKLNLTSPITGYTVGANTALVATDTILQAFGKVQGQINARVSGTIASGQVAFGTGTNTIGGDAGITWDNVNKRLLISPTNTGAETTNLNLVNLSTTTSTAMRLKFTPSTDVASGIGGSIRVVRLNSPLNGASEMIFSVSESAIQADRWKITPAGFLEGVGSSRIRVSSGNTLTLSDSTVDNLVLASSRVGVLTNSPTNTLDVNGTTRIRTLANATGNFVTTSATGVLQQRTAAEVRGDLALDTNYWSRYYNEFGGLTANQYYYIATFLPSFNGGRGNCIADISYSAGNIRVALNAYNAGGTTIFNATTISNRLGNGSLVVHRSSATTIHIYWKPSITYSFSPSIKRNEVTGSCIVSDPAIGTIIEDQVVTPSLTIEGTGVAGQVAFFNGTGSVTGDSGFTYNNSTEVLDFNGNLTWPKITFRASGQTSSISEIGRRSGSTFYLSQISSFPIEFDTNNILRWSILSTGTLQSNGAQTIQTSTGNLTLATAAGNGSIILSPNGTGVVDVSRNNQNLGGEFRISNSFVGNWIAGDIVGTLNFYLPNDTSTTQPIRSQIQAISEGGLTYPSFMSLKFSTANGNTLTEGFRLNYLGNVLIGTTTDSGDRLRVNGTVRIDSVTNATGDIVTIDANNVLRRRTIAETIGDLGISPSSYQRDKFTYSASNVFTITRNTPNAVMVFLNGQKLQFTDDWSISGSDVTVSTPLLSGDEISIEYFYSTPDVVSSNLNGTGTANYLTKWNGTAELGVSLIQDNGSLVTLPAATDIPAVAATTDTDKFVVLDGNRFKFRTGSEVLNDIGVRTSISLTTTGTSGLATYNSTTGVFNIPNYTYTHPSYTTRSITATGASVLSTFTSDASGHVTGITTRTLTAADIGAAASSHNQAASTITAGTFATGNFVFQGNLDINGQISSPSNAKGNSGTGTVTFNWNDGNMQTVTLNGNCTFAFSNPKSGGVYQIIVTRDATANRTITWPAGIKWGNGVAWEPSGANIIDIITISYDGTTYFAVVTTDMKTI